MNSDLVRSIVVHGGVSVLLGIGSAFLAIQMGIPLWGYLCLLAVGVGMISHLMNEAEKKKLKETIDTAVEHGRKEALEAFSRKQV